MAVTVSTSGMGMSTCAKDYIQLKFGISSGIDSAGTYTISGMTTSDKLLLALEFTASPVDNVAPIINRAAVATVAAGAITMTKSTSSYANNKVLFAWLHEGA